MKLSNIFYTIIYEDTLPPKALMNTILKGGKSKGEPFYFFTLNFPTGIYIYKISWFQMSACILSDAVECLQLCTLVSQSLTVHLSCYGNAIPGKSFTKQAV